MSSNQPLNIEPKRRSKQDILDLLQAGSFNEILGTLETDEVDFKEFPYKLDSEDQKYCLIEDIASFANASGGIIVFGFDADKGNVLGEYASKLRPVPAELIDFGKYKLLCTNLIYPPVKGLQFYTYSFPADETKRFAAIWIPPASSIDRPHLLAHVLKAENKKKTTRYALVEREGPENLAYPVHALHNLIRTGSSLGNVQEALRSIETTLQNLVKPQEDGRRGSAVSPTHNSKRFTEEIAEFLAACDLSDRATLVMGAAPSERVKLNAIFDGQSPLAKAFDSAPELRPNGFSFYISKPAQLVGGKYRRKVLPGYKAAQISTSGRLMVAVPADEDFLAWAQQRKPGYPVVYRSFVLMEVTYLFAKQIKEIFSLLDAPPQHVDLSVALRNAYVDELPPRLSASPDHNMWHFGWVEPLAAPKPDLLKTSRLPFTASTERFAFEIRACLYRRFGFGDEMVPYATVQEEGRITTPEYILNPNLQ